MAYTATPEQEVWMLKHQMWSLFDDGLTAEAVTAELVDEGYPEAIVAVFIAQHAGNVAQVVHDPQTREIIINSVKVAIQQQNEAQKKSAQKSTSISRPNIR